MNTLRRHNVNSKYVRIIKDLNTNNKTQVKTNQNLTKEIDVKVGIRQAESLSSTLFNIIMNEIIEEVKELHIGYEMANRSLGILCYADDATLMAESEDDLQRLLFKFERAAEKYNMIISAEKPNQW